MYQILQVAWPVARTSNFVGPTQLVPFETVLVNVGNAWNSSANTVIIPHSGYYLIHFSTGLQPGHGTWYHLDSENPNNFIVRDSTVHNGIDTMAKSDIKFYRAGTVVYIANSKTAPSSIYSDARMQITFSGLLIFKD